MGLHLCYRLTLPGETSSDEVRSKLAALKDFATTIGFDKVLGPTQYTADDLAELSHRDIIGIVTGGMCGEPADFYGRGPDESCVFAFVVVPGADCEPATFGFVAPGSRAEPLNDADDLHPGEWFWSTCCKTQYASNISNEHLVHCHVGLVRLLDHAAASGITVEVEDETGYWQSRDENQLISAVADMNRLIARFAGALSDRLGNAHEIEAPIFDHPEFEHLEMQALEPYHQADGDPRTP